MPENPFKFLEAYQKADKDRFFGRTKETAQLFNAVHASNLILLYGTSGTGKTSLINCGLANQFHNSDWLPVFIRRGGNINDSLSFHLSKTYNAFDHEKAWYRAETTESLPPVEAYRNMAGQSVEHMIQDLYKVCYRPVYLIFDQFEELYILGNRTEQDQFHKTVFRLLASDIPCKILLSIREEYLASLNAFEKAVPSLFDNRLRIERMDQRNLIKVILGTARWGGIRIDHPKTTVNGILDNLRDTQKGVDLTNLQVYMDRLWRKDAVRQGARTDQEIEALEQIVFDPALVEEVGPMQNVLSEFLDDQLIVLEDKLKHRHVENPKGLPLEVLFTLVTDDGTKRGLDLDAILANLPKQRKVSKEHLSYCLSEFQRIRVLRALADEE